jgi:hypothetical protein
LIIRAWLLRIRGIRLLYFYSRYQSMAAQYKRHKTIILLQLPGSPRLANELLAAPRSSLWRSTRELIIHELIIRLPNPMALRRDTGPDI